MSLIRAAAHWNVLKSLAVRDQKLFFDLPVGAPMASAEESYRRFFTTAFARDELGRCCRIAAGGRVYANLDALPLVYRVIVGELVLEAFEVIRGRLLGDDSMPRFLDALERLIWAHVVPIRPVNRMDNPGTAAQLESVLDGVLEISEYELLAPEGRVVAAVIPSGATHVDREQRVLRAVRCALEASVAAGVQVIVARGPVVEAEYGNLVPLGLCNIDDIDALSVKVDRALERGETLRDRDPEWLAQRLVIERRIRDDQMAQRR